MQLMAIDGRSTRALPGCGVPVSRANDLREGYGLPGTGVRVGGSTMVITAWHAERGDEAGVILLNDLALGRRFGGGAGFEAELREQGFVNERNLGEPCGKAAVIKVLDMWMCAEHCDEHARQLAQMGRVPENEGLQ